MTTRVTTFQGNALTLEYALERAEVTLARVPAFLAELEYVMRKTPMDGRFQVPPNWVQMALVLLSNKGGPFYYLRQINKPGNQWTPEDVGLVQGVIQSGLLFFSGGAPALEKDKQEIPQLKEYMDRMSVVLGDALKRPAPLHDNPSDKLPRVETTIDMVKHQEGLSTGVTTLFQADGTPHEYPYTYKVLGHMCTFWPQVEKFGSVRELAEWLEFDADIHCSIKLVEKACKQVGKKFGKQGRPRNKPTSQKT